MKTIAKLVMGAAMLSGLAVTAAPADAGVVVGVGFGGHPRHWCYRHPGACGGPVYVAGPRLGVFYGGRGWWDGHRYWGHRYWYGHGWRYR